MSKKEKTNITPNAVEAKVKLILKREGYDISPQPVIDYYVLRGKFGIFIANLLSPNMFSISKGTFPEITNANKNINVLLDLSIRLRDKPLFQYICKTMADGPDFNRSFILKKITRDLIYTKSFNDFAFFISHIQRRFPHSKHNVDDLLTSLISTHHYAGKKILSLTDRDSIKYVSNLANQYPKFRMALLKYVFTKMRYQADAVSSEHLFALLEKNGFDDKAVFKLAWENIPLLCREEYKDLIPFIIERAAELKNVKKIFWYPCFTTPKSFSFFIHNIMKMSVTEFLANFPYAPVQEHCIEMMSKTHSSQDDTMSCAFTYEQFYKFSFRILINELKEHVALQEHCALHGNKPEILKKA